MVDFFQNIFGKVISLMASVIIAVGLVSVPEVPEPLPVEQPKEEIVIEKVEIKETEKDIEKEKLNEEIETLNQEIQDLKNQEVKERNERMEREAIEENEKRQVYERTKAVEQELNLLESELQKQRESTQEILNPYPTTREENLQDEILLSKIKSDVSYLSGQINLFNRNIEQLINAFHSSIDGTKVRYENDIESYRSIYEPDMQRLHREILNEASKGIWTDCTILRSFWDSQNGIYQGYTSYLNTHKNEFEINTSGIDISYHTDLRYYLGEVKNGKNLLSQYLNELNSLSLSGVDSLKTEVGNLMSQLNEIETKINNNQSYSISVSSISSVLSVVDSLIREEKEWFAKTSCQNLPVN